MITNLAQLIRIVKNLKEKPTVVVPSANETSIIHVADEAINANIAKVILIGDKKQITSKAHKASIDPLKFKILHLLDARLSILAAIKIIKSGEADILMKGNINTDILLHEVLNKHEGLRKKHILSHVALFEIPEFNRLILLTDAGVNINPDISRKAEIIRNAVEIAHMIGMTTPKVAILAAVEKVVYPAMPATRDAFILSQMGDRKEFNKAIVEGPLALDNAVSLESAKIKRIKSKVAGKADVLVAPDIEAANILYKSLVHFAKAKVAGIVFGAEVPLIVSSRADTTESKLFSIAFGSLLSGWK